MRRIVPLVLVVALCPSVAAQAGDTEGAASAAVDRALSWLAAAQRDDGSWDGKEEKFDAAATGLALLALLGDGNTPSVGPYKRAVADGLAWIRSQQDPRSGLIGPPVSHEVHYVHAIATQALCEAQALSPTEENAQAAQAALFYVFRARNPYAAWRYDNPPIGDNDTSITGWMVQAICAGERAGLLLDEAAYEGALSWIDEVTDPETGRIGYDERGGDSSRTVPNEHFPRLLYETMTASGLVTRMLIARDHGGPDPREADGFAKQVALVADKPPRFERGATVVDHNAWLLGTQALWLASSEAWEAWWEALCAASLASQREDGSFDPDGAWGYAAGRVYSTSMVALALETPWRMAPLDPGLPDTRVERVAYRSPGLAVERALTWLMDNQEADGRWDAGEHGGDEAADVGVTGLALLALLRDGADAVPERHAEEIARATLWLLSQQDPGSGEIGPRDSHGFAYEHAIATLALCEASVRDDSPAVRLACQRAVDLCLRARNPYGVWRYDVPPIGDNDTSVTAWMVMALRAAHRAGLEVDDDALDSARSWLEEVTDPETARVGYDSSGSLSSRVPGENEDFPPERTEAMTAAGLATSLAIAEALDRPFDGELAQRQVERLLLTPPSWDVEGRTIDTIYWFFGTEALSELGGGAWAAWRSRIQDAVVLAQRPAGDGDDAGSWDPAGAWGFATGRAGTTALLALCCERCAADDGAQEGGVELAASGPPGPSGASVAVARTAALDWLAGRQLDDGSWPVIEGEAQHRVGVTALALLAFVEGDSEVFAGPHGQTVQRGLQWLRRQQDPDTGLVGDPVSHTFHYDHALATLALARAAGPPRGQTRDHRIQLAVDYILAARNPYSAWRYDSPPIGDNDTSVTSWMVAALEAAREAGAEVDEAAFQGASNWVDEVTDPGTGRIGYDSLGSLSSRTMSNQHFSRERGEAMTAAGIAIRRRAGAGLEGDLAKRQAALLLRALPEWSPGELGVDMYFWAHGTDALRAAGGSAWNTWRDAVRTAALAGQVRAGEERGSWDPVGPWGYAGGRVYATAMMCLALAGDE